VASVVAAARARRVRMAVDPVKSEYAIPQEGEEVALRT